MFPCVTHAPTCNERCFFCVAGGRHIRTSIEARPPIPAQPDPRDADPCLGCKHGRHYHANGYCTHPRSINPCRCDGGYYPR
jgi:hypothetical protein